jgi:hypothetical protein
MAVDNSVDNLGKHRRVLVDIAAEPVDNPVHGSVRARLSSGGKES